MHVSSSSLTLLSQTLNRGVAHARYIYLDAVAAQQEREREQAGVGVPVERRHLAPRQQSVLQKNKRPEASELVLDAAAVDVHAAEGAARAELFALAFGARGRGCSDDTSNAACCDEVSSSASRCFGFWPGSRRTSRRL